ncbi:hypothetical protein A1O1_04323 [Capronia coronata CBS 617.96]|uniref:Histone deacetylase domain-containing protein n=1 Tax=Capronia coronata CBS 617.96 TaxID=1182541 RepID=W9YF82_9EURO|nr:uncharacterized protein A1O1_04323 [Capronia coronata CBS 617.96]EXJ91213.1 hypothetical protein A1O1_04323 [Capronia coronata CBS 617.96]
MDPDIPAPSVEHDTLPENNNINTSDAITTHEDATPTPRLSSPSVQLNRNMPLHLASAASVPLPPSSPMRAPRTPAASASKPSSPKPLSRSPSVASPRQGERQTTPTLLSRRSTSNLSVSKGGTGTPQKPQYRRASSNLNPSSPAPNGKMASTIFQERPPVTASSVSKDYFGIELAAHASLQSPVAVIVHDSCYGHRFSRPRASKNALATIVERPERIHATLLGASAAYVRLGGRHAEGRFAPRLKHHSSKVQEVPFQIRKTTRSIPLTHPSVAFVHGSKWMEELQIMCDTAEGKLALNGKELVRPIGYGKDESGNALPKLHEGDLYLCAESLAALQGCLGGVCDAVDTVLSSSTTTRAFVCIRPPGHHCSSNYPSGFCWLNNVHVGIAYGAMNHGLTHAAIIDFDLHHGDGSQNIAWDQNRKAQAAAKNSAAHKKTPIGYYSLHDINSYPCEWGDEDKIRNASLCIENAHGQSIWNVHLEPWKSPEEFWRLYETKYMILLEKARIFLRSHTAKLRASGTQQPKAAIFISAGFDASEWEGAGMQRHSVNVPTDFYARFTADIVKLSHEEDLGVDGRVISVLEGGYSDRALTSGVFSHICGLSGDTIGKGPVTSLMADAGSIRTINNWVPKEIPTPVNGDNISYSPDWWALHNLEELEAVVAGRQPPESKASKDKSANYSSPTQASTLKMTEHARERQSLSAVQARLSLESEYEPPPPDVDWAVASYELSRVIIPSDRQTVSCTHEELNAEATKARRERLSNGVSTAAPEERMQLRGRKPRAPAAALPTARLSSRNSSRRTTIAAVNDLPDPSLQQQEHSGGRPRRRSSDASSILSGFQSMKISEEGSEGPANLPIHRPGNVPTPPVAPEKPTKAVAVKKTRTVPVTKGPPKPKTSPRKLKAITSTVVGGAPNTNAGTPVHSGHTKVDVDRKKRATPTSSQDESAGTSRPDEMDSLTNGLKKISIKLKVPSPEEHAAKQQQKTLEDRQKKPRAPRKPLLPKPTKPIKASAAGIDEKLDPTQPKAVQREESLATAITNGSIPNLKADDSPRETGPSLGLGNVKEEQASSTPLGNQHPHQVPSTSSNWAQFQTPAESGPVATNPADSIQGSSYEPIRFSTTPSTTDQTQQHGYPVPNINSEPVKSELTSAGLNAPVQRTKQDLPVFTSQSPIPFATPPSVLHNSVKENDNASRGPSVWDVPQMPRQT